jgi:hypothetical protein
MNANTRKLNPLKTMILFLGYLGVLAFQKSLHSRPFAFIRG